MASTESGVKLPSFVELLGQSNPAVAIGAQIVETLRINYWDKLRELARQDPARRAGMPGMIVHPDTIVRV